MQTLAQQHEARGAIRDRKTLLQKMLESIFGPLTEDARKRIAEATPEQLESWALSVCDAARIDGISIDDVLNSSGR